MYCALLHNPSKIHNYEMKFDEMKLQNTNRNRESIKANSTQNYKSNLVQAICIINVKASWRSNVGQISVELALARFITTGALCTPVLLNAG